MRLKDHISRRLILTDLNPADKMSLLETLAEKTANLVEGVESGDLLDRMLAREREGSTGVGQGIAIPHSTFDDLEETICVLAQIPDGVDYDSIDQQKVYFVFFLVSPSNAVGTHLRLLARISRVSNREEFVQQVTRAATAEEVYDLVVAEDERHVD